MSIPSFMLGTISDAFFSQELQRIDGPMQSSGEIRNSRPAEDWEGQRADKEIEGTLNAT